MDEACGTKVDKEVEVVCEGGILGPLGDLKLEEGTGAAEDGGEPFEEKMQRLTAEPGGDSVRSRHGWRRRSGLI